MWLAALPSPAKVCRAAVRPGRGSGMGPAVGLAPRGGHWNAGVSMLRWSGRRRPASNWGRLSWGWQGDAAPEAEGMTATASSAGKALHLRRIGIGGRIAAEFAVSSPREIYSTGRSTSRSSPAAPCFLLRAPAIGPAGRPAAHRRRRRRPTV